MALLRSVLPVLLILFSLNCSSGNNPETKLHQFTGTTMGTTFSIKFGSVFAKGSAQLKEINSGITRLLQDLNQKMSTYIEDSELSRFNSYQKSDWFPVSSETVYVIDKSLQISRISGGAFDITVGSLVNIWGFGPQPKKDEFPDHEIIERLKQRVGFEKITIRLKPPALQKKDPQIYCDLSAIAKGYGVDLSAQYLDIAGIKDYLVEIGGEVRTKGKNPQKKICWKIGISVPQTKFDIQRAIFLQDASMATSGDYRNYFEKDGIRFSHTIDPRTGRPVSHRLASVTVILKSCIDADAYATALNVMGDENGLVLARKEKLAALFIVRRDNGFEEIMTPEFKKLLEIQQ